MASRCRPTRTAGLYTLYTVTHAPFESIQVFALDARAGEPSLTWTGCVKLPADFKTNSVTATSDGTIIANVQMKNGAIQADYMVGKITGGVYEWKPADKTWRLLPGTELAGNNGIEISRDEKEIYVAVSGTQTVVIYSLADTSKPLREAHAIWFNIDNIHWSGDRLVTLGVIQDEPACGGTRKEIVERKGDLNCHRGWVAAELDPASLHWKVLSYGEAIADFGGEVHGPADRQYAVAELEQYESRRLAAAAVFPDFRRQVGRAAPIFAASRNACVIASALALPCPAMSKAVPCAGVVIGAGKPPATVTPRSKPSSLTATWPWS